ncbi:S8 family peptidase [Lysobacter brunescens]|uniref:S8 family serine peptidase n=1 Tax=Lysobacter brunescens TaxID=262323 RepID=A0ABW2YHG1_9GAMM
MSFDVHHKGQVKPLVAAMLLAVSSMAAPAAFAGQAHLSGLQTDTQFDQFIVKYRSGTAERNSSAAIDRGLQRATQGIARSKAGQAVALKHFRRMSLGADVIRANRALGRSDAEALMRRIAADPNVEYVEVDVRMYPVLTPNDTRYTDQWHYYGATAGINAPAAWDKSNGSGIVVAVVDTGRTPHSDLDANTVAGYDFITNTWTSRDGNGRDSNPNDEGDWSPTANECYQGSPTTNSSWHGTHVAGTIGAVTNNSKGVAGVAYGAKIQHVRVLGRCGGTLSDIADGVTWASGGTVSGIPANATPANIVNMSLGGGGACSTTYQNAINGAVGRGTTVIVAAGNSNGNAANFQPASCANVVTIGAIDSAGKRSVWSTQYNQLSNYGSVVDLSAPGSNIWSTLNAGTQGQGAESYASYGGTSMATPHVAGVAALVQSRRKALGLALYSPSQLETLLKNTVRPFPQTPDQLLGAGMLNADAAVTAAGNSGGGGGTQTYTNSADYTIADNATVESPVSVSGRTGNGPTNASVAVAIVHTYIADLKVDLVAPDGSVYVLHNRAGGSADNINQTYTVNLSSEPLNGTWKLRVNDNYVNDTGYINSWSVTF